MNLGKITVVTPPDRLFNAGLSFMLIKPSAQIKQDLHAILSNCLLDVSVFVYDENDNDIGWMLSTSREADVIVINIDGCDHITKQFISLLLVKPNVFYFTTDELTPYNLLSTNRVYNLEFIIENLSDTFGCDSDEESEE